MKQKSELEKAEATEANSAIQPKRSVARKIGTGAYRLTGLDVLTRDIKRVKPRFPNLWRDIASGEWRKTNNQMSSQVKSYRRSFTIATICSTLTVMFALYWLLLFHASKNGVSMSWMPLVTMGALVIAAAFQSGAYWYIGFIQRKRQSVTASSAMSDQERKHHD